MKGIILAGGTGSRLFPLTKVTNKHLLPVGRYPMIFHPIGKLAEAGIHEILIVTGTDHMGDVVGVLGSGHELGLDFTFKVQDTPGGIAQALGLAENFVGGESCVVILGDNIIEDPIVDHVAAFASQSRGARVLLKEVDDPERFGVATLHDGNVTEIQEKPEQPKTRMAVTGIYMYDNRVFEIVSTLRPSGRGELEITDVNNAYIHDGSLKYDVLSGWWTDAGTQDSYEHANHLAASLSLPVFEGSVSYGASQE